MCAIRRLLLPLLTFLTLAGLPARGQVFFPGGEDLVSISGGPGGFQLVQVIDHISTSGLCILDFIIPPGKSVVDIELLELFRDMPIAEPLVLANGSGKLRFVKIEEFERVGMCPPAPGARASQPVAQGAAAGKLLPVSNDGDSIAQTCDGRFLVVVGANSATPISLVDVVKQEEVDTFAAESNVTYVETFDDGESVVVIANIPPQNDTNRLRRLKIVNGKLVDTGESLAAGPTGTKRRFQKVFAVPGSKVGVATAQFGDPQVVTFSIPGLQVLDSVSPGGDSAVVSCDGDKVWLRNGSQIRGYTLDPLTGVLGDTPFLTISNVGQTDAFLGNFGNALAISRDGTRLLVPEGTQFPNSPPTPRITYFDTTTGARLGFTEPSQGGSPTLVSTYSCCAELPAPPAVSTVLLAKGSAAPGAGAAGGPPVDALLAGFGVPAIDGDGRIAFTAKWTSATAGKGSGLFTDAASVAIVGGAVPGVSGATFRTFSDPLIDSGRVAFLATLDGVPKSAASAVASDVFGGVLDVIARTGDEAPGANSAKFKSFEAVGLEGISVGFLATLAAPKTNDVGLWATDGTHPLTLLLREGQTIGPKTIKTLVSFKVGNGSPGQGRGWLLAPAAGTQALALVKFNDLTQAVVAAGIDGTVAVLSQSGPGGTGGPGILGASFASYGIPAVNAAGHSVFAASLSIGAGGVTKQTARGIFANLGNTTYTPLARAGDAAGATGGTFAAFKDAVLGDDGGIAFPATLAGVKGLAKSTLWHQPSADSLTLLAQGGAPAPGTSGQWNSFTSLGIAEGFGPLFSASLVPGKGGVKASNANGVWGASTEGNLSLLFRTGQDIDGKKLKSFTLLNAAPGVLGSTRSSNNAGQVVWRATFTDNSTAIISTQAP